MSTNTSAEEPPNLRRSTLAASSSHERTQGARLADAQLLLTLSRQGRIWMSCCSVSASLTPTTCKYAPSQGVNPAWYCHWLHKPPDAVVPLALQPVRASSLLEQTSGALNCSTAAKLCGQGGNNAPGCWAASTDAGSP